MRFGYWSAVALVGLSVACGGGGGDGDDKVCDAGKVVDCADVPSADVGGARYVVGLANATCADDGKSWNVTQCTPAGSPAFGACTTTADCQVNLECVDMEPYVSQCLARCGTSNPCASGTSCVQTEQNGDGFCVNTVGTGEQCYVDDNCAQPADICLETGADEFEFSYSACTRNCDDVGTQDTCAGGETCVPNSLFIQCQGPNPNCSSNTVACNINGPNTCNAAQGYRCMNISSTQTACARVPGVCIGRVIELSDTVGALTELANAVEAGDFSNTCGLPYEPQDEAPFDVYGSIFTDNSACGLTGVTGIPADVGCYRLGLDFGACVAFCEAANGDLLDCGSGYTCGRPTLAQALFVDPQLNGTARVPCAGAGDNAACDTANGYTCDDFITAGEFLCVIPSRTCLPN